MSNSSSSNSPRRPSRDAHGVSPSTPVSPTVQAALSTVDPVSMWASLEVIAAALQHATELASLEEDHRTLQAAFVDREARIRELEQELQDGYAAAAPFVHFVERRYGLMRHQRDEARESLAECLNALQERLDNATQLARLRERLRLAEEIHAEATTRLRIQIADLESRLAAARSTAAVQKFRRLAQRVTTLSSELAVATTELASSRDSLSARDQALANATAELQAHEVSQKALEDSVTQLQNQVGALERRLSRSQAELSTVYAARDRFSDEAVAAEAESLRLASELKQAVVERDRSAMALQRSQSQVNSFRAAIARLEGRVSDLQSNHNRLQALEKEIHDLQGANASLEADIASVGANRHVLETQCEQLTRERDSMRASRDHAVQERDAIRTQVATLASSVSASSGGVSTLLSSSASSNRHRHKRVRSRSAGSHHGRSSRRRRRLSPVPSRRNSRGRSRLRRAASGAISSDSDSDESVLAALSDLRADRRRREISSSGSFPSRPISLDSSSHGNSSESSDLGSSSSCSSSVGRNQGADQDADPGEADSGDSDRRGANERGDSLPDGSPPDSSGDGSVNGSDRDSDHSSVSDGARPPCNLLLTSQLFDRLPPTGMPRDHWVPGYGVRTQIPVTHVSPWHVKSIRRVCVQELNLDLLFHHFSKPKLWIFPRSYSTPSAGQWNPELIDETHVRALYAATPWRVLTTAVAPISFVPSGALEPVFRRFSALRDHHQQALWEASHFLSISPVLQSRGPYLRELCHARKQRRSRLGAAWKRFLQWVLRCMVAGECDLDVLLDPFIVHYPRHGEQSRWYTGFNRNPVPADLIDGLRLADDAEPWRNQFRTRIQDHPGSHLARLAGKFIMVA